MIVLSRTSVFYVVVVPLLCLLAFPPAPSSAEEETPIPFDMDIRPLLDRFCVDCHNLENLKGDLNLDRFTSSEMAADALGVWQRAARRISDREMPPSKADQPTDEERDLLLKWVAGLEPSDDCNKITSEESVSWHPGYVMSRRLNRSEYENTIRDLFGMEIPVAHLFPADGAGGEGFDNHGDALFLSAIQIEKYLEAADLAVETALPSDSVRQSTSPNPPPITDARLLRDIRSRLIPVRPSATLAPRDAAAQVLEAFLSRAWRRPPNHEETAALLAFFDEAHDRGDSFVDAVKLAMKGALISPHFMFLAEPEPEQQGDYPLGSYQMASRLSYFLWASMPDDELFQLASDDLLQNNDVLRYQVVRMLKDEKAGALGRLFASQWLGIVQLGETLKPDTGRFPEFDQTLLASMKREPELFFTNLVAENRSLLDLLDSDYTYMDQRLAEIYGVEDVTGDEMRYVQLASAARGGVLGMPAILTATSHPLRTSPVLRGKWVLEQLLGDHMPPPPPDAGTLPEDDQHAEGLTLREQLELHRRNPDCASCHNRMDPLGFGLENFDPIGRWRELQAGQPVDAQGVLPSGESFNGPAELKAILLSQKDAFTRNMTRKVLGYALGRSLTRYDMCVVEQCMEALKADEYRPLPLFQEIALSYPFRHRYSGGNTGSTQDDEQ